MNIHGDGCTNKDGHKAGHLSRHMACAAKEVDEDEVELSPCQTTECGKNHTRYLFWCAAHTEVDGHADKHDPWNTEGTKVHGVKVIEKCRPEAGPDSKAITVYDLIKNTPVK